MLEEPRAVLDIWLRSKLGSAEPMDRWAVLVAILCWILMSVGCLGAIALGFWARSFGVDFFPSWTARAAWFAIVLIAANIFFVVQGAEPI